MADIVWLIMFIIGAGLGFICGWFFNENFHIDFTKGPKIKQVVDATMLKENK